MAVLELNSAKALTDRNFFPVVLIFLFLVYIANPLNIWSGDTVGTTVFLLNLAKHHTIYFDALRHSDYWPSNAYFAAPAQNDHLANAFPIGAALVFGPMHLLFYAITTAVGFCPPADVFSQKAEYCRLLSDKWTSALLATASAGLYWILIREYVKLTWLRFASFVFFALGTNVFMIASQSNWQQGVNVFLCLCAWLLMLTDWPVRRRIVLLAVIGGLLVSTRPTNVFFLLPFAVWLVLVDRKRLIPNALLGISLTALLCLPVLCWNILIFGNIEGGYNLISDFKPPFFFTGSQFQEGFLGLWFSPAHGLLIFTPLVVFGLASAAAIHPVNNAKHALLAAWMCAAAVIALVYCFYREWWGGWSFGPRFLTDVIPSLSVGAAILAERYKHSLAAAFVSLGLIGCFNQLAGAFAPNNPATYGDQWDALRPMSSKGPMLWNWTDSPLVRDYRAIYYKIFKPAEFAARPDTVAKSAYCPLKIITERLEIKNTGGVSWIGASGGTGYPPSLDNKSGQHFHYYYLINSVVPPGQVGLFVSSSPPNSEVPLEKMSMEWGGVPVRLKCDSR